MKTTQPIYAIAILAASLAASAEAGVVIAVTEAGGDVVVATATGTIDLTDLTWQSAGPIGQGSIDPSSGYFLSTPIDSFPPNYVEFYEGFSGPSDFGAEMFTSASSHSGDAFGFYSPWYLFVPIGYSSGYVLSSTITWDGATFESLGLRAGSYVYTWGSGSHADSITLNIGAAVPEQPSLTMAGIALGSGLFVRRRARRAGRAIG